jgi:hypothetical protein
MNKIVIEIRGGLVEEVYTDCNAEIVIVDWDNIEQGDGAAQIPGLGLKRMSEETAKEADLLASEITA